MKYYLGVTNINLNAAYGHQLKFLAKENIPPHGDILAEATL